jgi:hydrogenase maturation protein HypF
MSSDPGRIDYPFINCTNCGPRFTIIRGLPYDRPVTTMSGFSMCSKCSSEYNDLDDRRFHAQPIACNSCGPSCEFTDGKIIVTDLREILAKTAGIIDGGGSVALKGVGGYHLACDALNNDAVVSLRLGKNRDMKPFAVMFRDLAALKKYCHADRSEEKELLSWIRPVVLLKSKRSLAPQVSNGLGTTGAFLPFMPFHYLLFRHLKTPAIVLTSGNISEEPVIKDDNDAVEKLLKVTNALVSYNREISNRADDSVIMVTKPGIMIIRRSRGFVPRPVDLAFDAEGILALGAEQKKTFSIGRKDQAIMGQYTGDLKNAGVCEFYRESIDSFSSLFRFSPRYIAHDLHPDYYSTLYASILSKKYDIPSVAVQHHHAHIASCLAEHCLDEKVIGVSLDGTGYGTDGNTWGGEFMIADTGSFERYCHFDYVPMPGGDRVIDEPWRMAFSYLYKYLGDSFDYNSLEVFRKTETRKLDLVREMLKKNINSPLTSGAGRLFDAVSALTGLCHEASFDSEAPMRLESAIKHDSEEYYPFRIADNVVFADMLLRILDDLNKVDISEIAVRFHNTIVQVIVEVAERIRRSRGLMKVVLSGGVFQNRYLLERTFEKLEQKSFRVYTNHQVPVNDGGLSLGQTAVASKYFGLCV